VSGVLFFCVTRRVLIDVELCAATSLALACFVEYHSSNRPCWLWAFYAGTALAFMLKGSIGVVIPMGTAAVFLCASEGFGRLRLLSAVNNMALTWLLLALAATVLCALFPGRISFAGCVLTSLVSFVPGLRMEREINEELSTRSLCRYIQRHDRVRMMCCFLDNSQPTIFYLRRPLHVIGYVPREFRFGRTLGDYDRMFPSIEAAAKLAEADDGLWCLVSRSRMKIFQKHLGRFFTRRAAAHRWTLFQSVGPHPSPSSACPTIRKI